MRPFRLPGGERAIREPRRTAFGLLYEIYGTDLLTRTDLAPVAAFREPERRLLIQMLDRAVNSPVTTSAGRLFDAVASLCGLRQEISFEGQAAMELEFAVDERAEGTYSIPFVEAGRHAGFGAATSPLVLDWQPAIESLLDDAARGMPLGSIALKFHNALVGAIVAVAQQSRSAACRPHRRLLSEPRFSWSMRSAVSRQKDFERTGTSACRPTTAASRSARLRRRHRMARLRAHARID